MSLAFLRNDHPVLQGGRDAMDRQWLRTIRDIWTSADWSEAVTDNTEIPNANEVGYRIRLLPSTKGDEKSAVYALLDGTEYGLYIEIAADQSQVGPSAIKIVQRGLGDGCYIAIIGDGTSGYGYEAAMFGGDQGGDVDKQENGFLGSFQGAGGFQESRKKQSNSIPFHALVHDDGSDPTAPDAWSTNYGLFYANNSLSNAFRVRCSAFALEYPQIALSGSDLAYKWAVYTSGDMYNFGAPATAGAQNQNSHGVVLTGYYWDGAASQNRRSRLVTSVSGAPAGKASLYVYCGPSSGETLIGYFSEVADGTNPGLNLQNNRLTAVSRITFQTAAGSLLDLQGGDISNVDDITMAGATSLLDMQRAPISNCGALTGYAADNPRITGFLDADFTGTTVRVQGRRTISASGDAGNNGDLCWDTNYLYVSIGASTWRRIALGAAF